MRCSYPPAGCGQLIGSDDYGHGITARIAGPGVGMVYVAGELYLAQQLVFRAVATGAACSFTPIGRTRGRH